MKDKETGLTFRTLQGVENFIAETIVGKNAKYTFAQGLRDAGYTSRYVSSFGSRIWDNIVVQSLITKAKAALTVKTGIKSELTREKVLKHIESGMKEALHRKNLPAIARFAELEARTLGMLTDNITTTDLTRQKELDEREKAEAAELARLRLGEKYGLEKQKAVAFEPDTVIGISPYKDDSVTATG